MQYLRVKVVYLGVEGSLIRDSPDIRGVIKTFSARYASVRFIELKLGSIFLGISCFAMKMNSAILSSEL